MKYINIDYEGHVNHKEPIFDTGIDRMAEFCATYEQLVKTFGEPNYETDGYYFDVCWLIFTPEGVVKIHNWKDGKNYLGDKGLEVEKILQWEISGHSHQASDWVLLALKLGQEV